MARRKFSIYLDEDLKLVLESIAKQEDRSLSKTFERACKLYADNATGKTEAVNPFPVPTKEEVESKPVPTNRSKTGFKRPNFIVEDLPVDEE